MEDSRVAVEKEGLDQSRLDQYSCDVTTRDVKAIFCSSLATLSDQARKDGKASDDIAWRHQCIKLEKEIVVKDVDSRPSAVSIRDELRKVEGTMSEKKDYGQHPTYILTQ